MSGLRAADLVIAGGGIVGLWLARFAAQAGLEVVLCDRRVIGSGASGGILGALMPHMPERWNAKKQFQFEALVALEDMLRALEAETGLSTGYGRIGRLLPLIEAHHRRLAQERAGFVADVWRSERFSWTVCDRTVDAAWPASAAAPHGVVLETLTARVDPRALLAALKTSLAAMPNVQLIEGDGVAGWHDGRALLDSGGEIRAGHLAVTAGFESFPLLESLMKLPPGLGRPVKGQAALIEADIPADRPLVFCDGVYVVPHADGRVAVGSTSEDAFDQPRSTDARLDAVIAKARALCPELAEGRVVERWAGLRPKAVGREPIVGAMPGAPAIIAATGGFKITFGIAHRMAEAALAAVLDQEPDGLPESFRPEAHLSRLSAAR